MTLQIIYACVRCRRLVAGDFYDLRQMFGQPIVCVACAKADTPPEG
jgi:DNA-directed RNA polymerase subunit RPC12/RpoP